MEIHLPAGAGSTVPRVREEAAGHEFDAESLGMQNLESVIRELANSEVPVLLLGERGVGKRTLARRIHDFSPRSGEYFRVLPCRVLWPEVFESSDQGGFLGRGTIYLDELDDLSPACQEQLVQALERSPGNGSQARVGLMCGSARDLEAEVQAGNLREDLYYRVSRVCLHLPPLRQRQKDLPVLMDHFLQKHAQELRLPVPKVGAETRRRFEQYSWPGNLRELEESAKAIVALGEEAMATGGPGVWLNTPAGRATPEPMAKVSLKVASRAASREAERELILGAMTRAGWNRRRAAEELQISYKALLYKLKQLGCEGNGASKTT